MKLEGKLFLQGSFTDGSVEFSERIDKIRTGIVPQGKYSDCYIIPGLIDIHTHGAMGEDASDGNADGMQVLSRYYAAQGVTSWLPTTMTLKEQELIRAVHVIRDFRRPDDGAKAAGIHMEGPFLSYAKRGAQAPENLHAPDIGMFQRINEESGGMVRIITIAPEEPGAMEFIQKVSGKTVVSLGHTTADYDTARKAYETGAAHATHLYNAMPPFQHREPGVIGAAGDCGATAELICDGLHIHPSVIRSTWRMFRERLVLVSDSLCCAGMPEGEYMLSGHPITVRGGKATLTGTDTLAGSSIHLMDAVRNCVRYGLPLEAAVYAATEAPAKAARLDGEIGSIACGKYADFVVLDSSLQIRAVYIDGIKI